MSQLVVVSDDPNPEELDLLDAEVPVPAHLADDPRAVELWRGYVQTAAQVPGLFEITDSLALSGMVEAELAAERAWAAMTAERAGAGGPGSTYLGTSGNMVVHPAYRVWRDSRAIFLRYAEHLGLTPVARTRLGVMGLAGRKLQRDLDATLPRNPVRRGGQAA